MKRKTLGGLVVLAISLSMATTVFGSDIRINNVKTSQSITTEIQNGYTMVPLRYISEQFGCEVSYNEEAKIAIVEKQEMSLKFPINSSTVYVNGTASQLDAPAFIKDNSTYVPLRFIVSTLGGTITYNEATKIININTNDGREVQADYFGNEIRTTDLPKDAELYPYIRADIPNWVYDKISLAMNNNAYGPHATTDFAGKRFLATAPKDVWTELDSGLEMWDTQLDLKAITGNGTWSVNFKTVFDRVLKEYLNIDYTKIGDTTKGNIWTTLARMTFSHFTIENATGIRTAETEQNFANNVATVLEQGFVKNKWSTSAEFTPLYECSWRSTDLDRQSLNVPVYVKIKIDSLASQPINWFGGNGLTNGTPDKVVNNYKEGDIYEGVVHVKLIKHKDMYMIDYSAFNLLQQLNPHTNSLDGLYYTNNPADKSVTNWAYNWTMMDSRGVLTLTKYEEFDIQKAAHFYSTIFEGTQFSNKEVFYKYTDLIDNGVIDNPMKDQN